MPVNLPLPDAATLYPIAGVRIGVTEAGIRKANRALFARLNEPGFWETPYRKVSNSKVSDEVM